MNNDRELTESKIREQNVSVYAYDLALVEDLRARFSKSPVKDSEINKNVQIGPTEQMYRIIGELSDDQPILPFVSLQRLNWTLNLDRQGYQTFVGDMVFTRLAPDNKPQEVRARVIPITINWQLSVWTKDRITNDAIVREILWYYHLRPSLLVYVQHGLNIAHKFNIYFNSEITDNSDIANHINNGTYFRQDLSLYSDDSYLWQANYINKVEVAPQLYFNYGVSQNTDPSYTNIEINTKNK